MILLGGSALPSNIVGIRGPFASRKK